MSTQQNDDAQEEKKETGEMTLEACQEKADEYLAGWRRAMADYQNREKDLSREKQELKQTVTMMIFSDLLPVLDNLRQAFVHVPADQQSLAWVQGIKYIIKQFEDVLAHQGVKPFSSLGLPFDPMRHDAVGEEVGEPVGGVVREVMSGYEMNGKVLRAARVLIGSSEAEDA